ncbi:hypothetical protein ACH41E_29085 [Streptomyces sp. NPDC020412]|uniref:hypothetical protein n=1 Tax=Streptomyces sp. NPDC020412 TaxID=3365073 RepID=UPI0037A81EB1
MNDSPADAPTAPAADAPIDPAAVPSSAVDRLPQPAPAPEPAEPAPLGVPRTPTGHPEVDAQLERLADVDHLTSDGHLEVYEDVHEGLRTTLSALDAGEHAPSHRPPHDHRS